MTTRTSLRLERMGELVVALLRNHRDRKALAHVARQLRERNLVIETQAKTLRRSKTLFDSAAALTRSGAWEWSRNSDTLTWTDGMYEIHDRPKGSRRALGRGRGAAAGDHASRNYGASTYPQAAEAVLHSKDRSPRQAAASAGSGSRPMSSTRAASSSAGSA